MLGRVSLTWARASLSSLLGRGVQHAMLKERALQHLPSCACRFHPAHTLLQHTHTHRLCLKYDFFRCRHLPSLLILARYWATQSSA